MRYRSRGGDNELENASHYWPTANLEYQLNYDGKYLGVFLVKVVSYKIYWKRNDVKLWHSIICCCCRKCEYIWQCFGNNRHVTSVDIYICFGLPLPLSQELNIFSHTFNTLFQWAFFLLLRFQTIHLFWALNIFLAFGVDVYRPLKTTIIVVFRYFDLAVK